jgi:hypothetical protein
MATATGQRRWPRGYPARSYLRNSELVNAFLTRFSHVYGCPTMSETRMAMRLVSAADRALSVRDWSELTVIRGLGERRPVHFGRAEGFPQCQLARVVEWDRDDPPVRCRGLRRDAMASSAAAARGHRRPPVASSRRSSEARSGLPRTASPECSRSTRSRRGLRVGHRTGPVHASKGQTPDNRVHRRVHDREHGPSPLRERVSGLT